MVGAILAEARAWGARTDGLGVRDVDRKGVHRHEPKSSSHQGPPTPLQGTQGGGGHRHLRCEALSARCGSWFGARVATRKRSRRVRIHSAPRVLGRMAC